MALKSDPPLKVWSLDKANVLATSRLWRKVVSEIMKNEYPQLELGHHLIDSAAMLMVKDPRALNGVVVTSNLFGDIISDEASMIPGSLGLLPSASLSGVPDGKGVCFGIYEPIHGEFWHLNRDWSAELTVTRICARYRTRGESQPYRSDPVSSHDATLFVQFA